MCSKRPVNELDIIKRINYCLDKDKRPYFWNKFDKKNLWMIVLNALKKQVPRKVKIYEEDILKCPTCNDELGYYMKAGYGYCMCCGQKIEFLE